MVLPTMAKCEALAGHIVMNELGGRLDQEWA